MYEWNYQKQLLTIKLHEGTDRPVEDKERHIFGPDFLLPRPLLRSITAQHQAPVLLIDEIDRADEEFEAFLLELLSDFQISIPEMGTLKATHVPYVILTSNRTRELSDALKRRCLYHWIEYPSLEKELTIVHNKVPQLEKELAAQVVGFIQAVRQIQMAKLPGVAETLDWATALLALGTGKLDIQAVEDTLGCVLKSTEDMARLKTEGIGSMLQQLAGA